MPNCQRPRDGLERCQKGRPCGKLIRLGKRPLSLTDCVAAAITISKDLGGESMLTALDPGYPAAAGFRDDRADQERHPGRRLCPGRRAGSREPGAGVRNDVRIESGMTGRITALRFRG
ncbi:MAG: hypothetical protein WD356_06845 [Pseudomonadales bacterium]